MWFVVYIGGGLEKRSMVVHKKANWAIQELQGSIKHDELGDIQVSNHTKTRQVKIKKIENQLQFFGQGVMLMPNHNCTIVWTPSLLLYEVQHNLYTFIPKYHNPHSLSPVMQDLKQKNTRQKYFKKILKKKNHLNGLATLIERHLRKNRIHYNAYVLPPLLLPLLKNQLHQRYHFLSPIILSRLW